VCVRPSTETSSFHFGNARQEAIIWNYARDIRETALMTAALQSQISRDYYHGSI
jgi:hypothetical protein